VVVTNATLHWVPGHLELLPRWVGALAPGGALALQVPANFAEPTHTHLRDLAARPRWREALAPVAAMTAVHSPDEYRQALRPTGAETDIWQTVYHHVLTGPDPVLEWVRGSALRPYLDLLDPSEGAAFEAAYAGALRQAYPADRWGETVLPFRRTFVVARLTGPPLPSRHPSGC
jgi:trans-aconitate 2-methyltransferase